MKKTNILSLVVAAATLFSASNVFAESTGEIKVDGAKADMKTTAQELKNDVTGNLTQKDDAMSN